MPVKRNTQFPTDIPKTTEEFGKKRNYYYFQDSSQATRQTMCVMFHSRRGGGALRSCIKRRGPSEMFGLKLFGEFDSFGLAKIFQVN